MLCCAVFVSDVAQLYGTSPAVMDLKESWFADADMNDIQLKRQQSMATLETLKQKSAAYREKAQATKRAAHRFQCATDVSEKPDLFKPVGGI